MSITRILAGISIIMLPVSQTVATETDQALTDLVKGDYLRAIPALTKRAENGDAQAQYQLAYIYVTGSGTKVNPAKGMSWFRAAANQGHRDAALQLRLLERRYRKSSIH